MQGFYTEYGYKARINGQWIEFATDEEAYTYFIDHTADG